jgi:hypothetical protein
MTPPVEQDRPETPKDPTRRKDADSPAQEGAGASVNTIALSPAPRRGPKPKKAPPAKEDPRGRAGARSSASGAAAKEAASGAQAVPDEIRERFIGIGEKYYFPDGTAAFTDHGVKLTTRSENTEVIRSLVAIAEVRGWGEIRLTGTERFRKEAWFAARLSGIEVRGYTPTAFEEERIVRAIARREAGATGRGAEERGEPSGESAPARPRSVRAGQQSTPAASERGPLTGRLVDHGRATYRHDPKEPMSYYVRLETERGDREIWGVDLERAVRDSLSRPTIGDEVTVRALGRDPVTVRSPQHDREGRVVGSEEIATHRNRWIIERSDFLAERAAAAQVFRDEAIIASDGVKAHPELQGSYLQLQAARLGAERDIRDSEDRVLFVSRAREAIANAIERAEPLEPVRLRENPAQAPGVSQSSERDQTLTR